jgi:hypothetical protein
MHYLANLLTQINHQDSQRSLYCTSTCAVTQAVCALQAWTSHMLTTTT